MVTGSETDIVAALAGMTAKPPKDLDADFQLTVTATSTETAPTEENGTPGTVKPGSEAAETTTVIDVTVAAVSDEPSVTGGTFSTDEDVAVGLVELAGNTNDTDNSEALGFEMLGVDEHASFVDASGDPVGVKGPVVTGKATWVFTDAEITGLRFVPPAQDDGTFAMTLRAIATDTDPDTGLTVASATKDAPVTVTVAPVVDAPVLADGGESVGLEDASIPLGSDIGLTIEDADGSQTLTVELTGIPDSATLTHGTPPAGTTFTDDTSGARTVTITGKVADVEALLDTLAVTPGQHEDANFEVTFTATSNEAGGAGTPKSDSTVHAVRVRAVADPAAFDPAPSITMTEGDLDRTVPVTVELKDKDGSETYQSITVSSVPDDATLSITPATGAKVTGNADGTFTIEGTDPSNVAATTAAIEATLAGGIEFTPEPQSGDDVTLRFTAVTVEAAPSEGATTDTDEVAVRTATTSLDVTIDLKPVADDVTATGGSFSGDEDTFIPLTGIGASSADKDGSETFAYTLTGVPRGARVGGKVAKADGTLTFTDAEVDAGLSFKAPNHVHGEFTMQLVATGTDTGGGDGDTAISAPSAPVAVVVRVDPVADNVVIAGDTATDEDQPVAFGSTLTLDKRDDDGSEWITEVAIRMPSDGAGGFQTATYDDSDPNVTVSVVDGVYTVTATGPVADAEADIRAAVATFAWTPPEDSDDNVTVNIAVTTGDYVDAATADETTVPDSSSTNAKNLKIVVRAVADAPSGTAGDVAGDEDTSITLDLEVMPSKDDDGSEALSVRLTGLPAGSIVAGTGAAGSGATFEADGDDWIVSAATPAVLNAALATATYTPPSDFSGTIEGRMIVISTEGASGDEVALEEASKEAVYDGTDPFFTITVNPIVDTPSLVAIDATEGAAGKEDEPIRLVVDIRPGDEDGSEEITSIVVSGIPPGAKIVDAGGTALGTLNADKTVTLDKADLAVLHVLAPPDSNEDFKLTVSATAGETGVSGQSTSDSVEIDVAVIGVADEADITASAITVEEDETIPFGTAIVASIADIDLAAGRAASEELYFVIEGLPKGTVPSAGTFIGGAWQVDADDMPGLTIAAPANFWGDYRDHATGLKVLAITQENDGDQTSVEVPVDITITPKADTATWSPGTTRTEDGAISLAGAAPAGLIDADGSEKVVSYTFDLTDIVADAQIGGRVTDADTFIIDHVNGVFTRDGNKIVVLADDLPGVTFDAAPFLDSNVDFDLPVDVVFTDTATVPDPLDPGSTITLSDEVTLAKTFSVDLVGDADAPTVFAGSVAGQNNTAIAINPNGTEFGGTTTDTDVALGRTPSEDVYYIVTGLGATGEPPIAFVDASGNQRGFANGSTSGC